VKYTQIATKIQQITGLISEVSHTVANQQHPFKCLAS